MKLRDVEQLKKLLGIETTIIIDGQNDEKVYGNQDFPAYLIVRKANDSSIDPTDLEDNRVFADDLRIQNPSDVVLAAESWFVIPLYPNIREARYLTALDSETLRLEAEPLFTVDTPIVGDRVNLWIDYPMEEANNVIRPNTEYIAEASFTCGFSSQFDTYRIKSLVNDLETIQKIRINHGNTIRNNMFRSLGKKRYDELKKIYGENYLDALMKEHDRIKKENSSDAVIKAMTLKRFKGTPLITDFTLYARLDIYATFCESEKTVVNALKAEVHKHPYWDGFMKGIKGLGEITAAHLIAKLNPYKARHPSSYIRMCGLDVRYNQESGRYEGTNKKHKRKIVYLNKNGDVQVTETLGYDVKLKAKLMGVLFKSFMMTGDNYYKAKYYEFKNYYANRPDLKERWDNKVKGDSSSAHKMAARKVMTMFVRDYWFLTREAEGLPFNGGDYAYAKLGITHEYDKESPIAHLNIRFAPNE